MGPNTSCLGQRVLQRSRPQCKKLSPSLLVFLSCLLLSVFCFLFLLSQTWQESLTSSGASTQWRQGTDPLIMLSTEMALRYPVSMEMPVTGEPAQVCGPTRANGASGCVNPLSTKVPSTAQLCQRYAGNNGLFLSAFVQAFAKMSAVGYGSVVSTVDGATTTGKLGTLTTGDLTTCPP